MAGHTATGKLAMWIAAVQCAFQCRWDAAGFAPDIEWLAMGDTQFFAGGVKADAAFPVQPMCAGVAAVIGPTLLFIEVGDEF